MVSRLLVTQYGDAENTVVDVHGEAGQFARLLVGK